MENPPLLRPGLLCHGRVCDGCIFCLNGQKGIIGMFTARIYISGSNPAILVLSRSFPNAPQAREWADGYCRRHPECRWEFE